MRSGSRGFVLGLLLVAVIGSHPAWSKERSSLAVVEGIVLDVGVEPGEGGLELVTVRLSTEGTDARELDLLLAPMSVMEETGFTVEQGDRIKARIFPSDDGPAAVHKVLNQTQGSMLRLRTLRQIPLWNGAGEWQGGPGSRGLRRHGQHQARQGSRSGSGPPF